MKRRSVAQFHRDPLLFLDQAYPADAFWLPERQLCIAEPLVARAILVNEDGLYEEHSDFFHTGRGVFGSRAAQVEIGRSARMLLRSYLASRAGELENLTVRKLPPVSEWPDAGNWLIYRLLVDVLIAPERPGQLRQIVDQIVERAVLAGARQRSSWWRRTLFRLRVERELEKEIQARRERGPLVSPADVLDVIVAAVESEVPANELAEVFLSFLFAVAGSVGFVLGWSVYLAGTHSPTGVPPGWIIQEALRLWPVAWLLGRRPSRAHQVAGVEVTPRDLVVVCPYLVHRHPQYWEEPLRFRPERWAEASDRQAFIPFGWGPHVCVAGALSIQLAGSILQILLQNHEIKLTPRDTRPCVGPALAPPRFTLALSPQRP